MKEFPQYKTIIYSQSDSVAKITLHRPWVQNAFDGEMIKELYDVFTKLISDNEIRCIILTGIGKTFCAGADLNWMKDVVSSGYKENLNESHLLAKLFFLIFTHPKPVIGRINGSAIGGGVGLVCVCDIAISVESAIFGLSEIKLGLIPAVISPYVIKRMGEPIARELMLTGELINSEKAFSYNLINRVVPEEKLDDTVNEKIKLLLSSAPGAISKTKELFASINVMRYDEILQYTAEVIANMRLSEEAQEGIKAFLENRHPSWMK